MNNFVNKERQDLNLTQEELEELKALWVVIDPEIREVLITVIRRFAEEKQRELDLHS